MVIFSVFKNTIRDFVSYTHSIIPKLLNNVVWNVSCGVENYVSTEKDRAAGWTT